MHNLAGAPAAIADAQCEQELTNAGIPIEKLPESLRKSRGEVQTIIIGSLHGWAFTRAWYYWIAKGPGIELVAATKLHEAHGKEVRVAGHGLAPSPLEWYKGLAVPDYHVDTHEGLKALADTIKELVRTAADRVKS
jgi:hypothetical protein